MDVHPFEGLDGQNHKTTEHAKGEGDSNRGLMPRPLQETPVLHELSIGQDAATATRTPAAADYETAIQHGATWRRAGWRGDRAIIDA